MPPPSVFAQPCRAPLVSLPLQARELTLGKAKQSCDCQSVNWDKYEQYLRPARREALNGNSRKADAPAPAPNGLWFVLKRAQPAALGAWAQPTCPLELPSQVTPPGSPAKASFAVLEHACPLGPRPFPGTVAAGDGPGSGQGCSLLALVLRSFLSNSQCCRPPPFPGV